MKQGHEGKDLDEDLRDLQENNQLRGVQNMPAPEDRDVRKAGGGTKGDSQGGAHTGRRGSHVETLSNRETKPRGKDVD